jgi:hypothetical protein
MSEKSTPKSDTPLPSTGASARARDTLVTLEYPRYLHKAGAPPRRVENESEARAAVADGWAVDANEPKDDKDAK